METIVVERPQVKRVIKQAVPKKKNNRSLFYRISAWLHLWLGLVTGLIMMVVCITACIWVFNDEITLLMEPETRVTRQNQPVLSPVQLKAIAEARYPGQRVGSASYQQGKAAYVFIGDGRTGGATLRVNPYDGTVISVTERKEGEADFFRWVLNGHRYLWLPPAVGRPIVNYGTLLFVFILITGMVLWWPKKWNKSTREKSFSIKWGASFKRVNYDLHNVLGFYSLLVVAAMALTGMVYGLEWYSKSLYWVSAGGESLPSVKRGSSDSLMAGKFFTPDQATEMAFNQVLSRHPEAKGFYCSFPDPSKPGSTIGVTIYPTPGKYYNNRSFAFDQHTVKPLSGSKVYETSFEKAPFAAKLRRMNYDIHVGSILGFPGKVLAFCAALIAASLPVTGFLVWWGKRKKTGIRTSKVSG